MSIDIHEVSHDNIVRLTRLLSRRPEYGIAIPSRRWLERQEGKLRSFPRELLFNPSPLKRLVTRIVDTIDREAMDPRAILCKTHASLNPFLLRRLFMAVVYEATVHSDALRSWEGRKRLPSIAAFVQRLDAIAALWTQPDVYSKCYGGPPFEGRMIFVKSGCEACILSAVGASARVLSDLRAMVIDRTERFPPRQDGRRNKKPRITRVIDAWIDHLKEERAAECRAMSDEILAELRAVRPEVVKWQRQLKKKRHSTRASRKPVYTELKRTFSGAHKLSQVPTNASRKRRTKHGIPVAMADREGAEEQRIAAVCSPTADAKSVYRPDSLCDSQVTWKQPTSAYYDSTTTGRPDAPEPTPLSGSSRGEPSRSFIERFEREVTVDNDRDMYDDYEDAAEQAAFEERDFEQEERSRTKVADWYSARLAESQLDFRGDDDKSVLSMMHPAFQPERAFSNSRGESTAWTDATVYTVNPSSTGPDLRDAPPVPRVPSRFNNRDQAYMNDDGVKMSTGSRSQTPRARPPSIPPGPDPRLSTVDYDGRQSTVPFPEYSDPFHEPVASASPDKGKEKEKSLNWPAPPPRPPTRPMGKPSKKYLFKDSDVGSRLSTHDRQYLRDRRGMQTYTREENPFTRTHEKASSSFSSAAVPSMSSSHGTEGGRGSAPPPTPRVPRPSTAQAEREWRAKWGVRDEEEDNPLRPSDSASNVMWARENLSSVTNLGAFIRKGMREG
ncbi:hypothetical protein F4779DRAFT_220614 [Xylariaceae sp. FL0662B]|nr:hypothetical protein F4779DRAFT_220614 [Xylariaceae sp. FL0662B]